jgi:voltage-gated potassium channel
LSIRIAVDFARHRAAFTPAPVLPGRMTRCVRREQHTPRVTEPRRSFIRTRTQRAVVGRRVFPFLAFTTLTVALVAGFVVTIIDKEDFPDYGTAVWWAIVTLGTVGYGDVVPHTGWGRVVGSVVIIVGVTFIAFLTAVVTSLFVEEEQKTHRTLVEDAQRASQDETRRLLQDLSTRLSIVETLLRDIQGQRR